MKGNDLALELGFSHPVEFKAPAEIKLSVDKNVITVEGFDKQLVGETAAQIRKLKKPEPYQGKGIKYLEEVVRRKAGKTAAKSAA
jgi:large subunit ribosomal protein L6